MHVNLFTLTLFSSFSLARFQTFPQSIRIEWNKFDERAVTECMCKSGVDPALVKKMIDSSQYANDPCFKCYLKCLITERGLMDQNGEYIVNSLVLHMANVTFPIANECVNQYLAIQDGCEKAYQVGLCLMAKLSSNA